MFSDLKYIYLKIVNMQFCFAASIQRYKKRHLLNAFLNILIRVTNQGHEMTYVPVAKEICRDCRLIYNSTHHHVCVLCSVITSPPYYCANTELNNIIIGLPPLNNWDPPLITLIMHILQRPKLSSQISNLTKPIPTSKLHQLE